jgi:putative transposase
VIDRPNQVWYADIIYIPMRRGFLYLVAIMYWYSRKVFAWRLSNSINSSFCVEILNEALIKHSKPAVFNTDQGSQFNSSVWINVMTDAKIKISMDERLGPPLIVCKQTTAGKGKIEWPKTLAIVEI